MSTLEELFEVQKNVTENVLGIEIKEDPMEYYYSVNGIVQEAMEALQEDTRWKEIVFRKPGYKFELNREKKVVELADILIYLINACMYSGISAEELNDALIRKSEEKVKKFQSMKRISVS